jgi:glycerol-3-phosphate dehydrogenase
VFDDSELGGVYSIIGGSFTTHRNMAEDVVDRVSAYLDVTAECRTAEEELRAPTTVTWSAEAPMNTRLFAHHG